MQTYAFMRPAAPCVQAGVGACRRDHLAWNFEAITATLAQFTCVKLYMAGMGLTRACLVSAAVQARDQAAHAGHDHIGGYAYHSGIHWLTVEAVLEGEQNGQVLLL